MKTLNLIVACAENRVIGRGGGLPWRIPEDWKFFQSQTAGQTCVLGRNCFESWPGATRAGRRPVVIASRPLAPRRAGGTGAVAGQAESERSFDAGNRLQAGSYMGRQGSLSHPPIVVSSVAEALVVADGLPGEPYICGGQRVYEETLALAGVRPLRLFLTLIHAEVPGDRFFPEWRHLAWREVGRRESADANFRYTFFTLELFAARKA